MRTPIVAGNWKMHGSRDFARAFVEALAPRIGGGVEVLLFPPQVLLGAVVAARDGHPIGVGAQTVHPEPAGAFTGETSAELVRDAGADWTLVGHSERRQHFGEDDAAVAARVAAAVRAGLAPLLCVGETLEERRAGAAESVVMRQLDAVLSRDDASLVGGAVAYEPVWAIGTGETATPAQAQAMHAVIRERLAAAGLESLRVLYGGSVKADNAAELFAEPDIDGGLVGGASLDADSFAAIVAAARA
ncbi:MAG: triose-phosphate isomerase [Pseudomonadales bacterium]|jgi:triosephosphate isomerase|nr:triose-phosphate isomerase [Pseudomonadales bacterium]